MIKMEVKTINERNILCRVCMQTQADLYPIFETEDDEYTIADKISECTKFPVENDKLPQNICYNCREAARSAFNFKRKTEDAYLKLKALYDKTWVPKKEKGSLLHPSSSSQFINVYTQTDKTTVFQCECCPLKFFAETELRLHRQKQHIYDAKKCRVCNESFTHFGQLKVHLSTEHPNEGIRCDYKCHLCLREFARRDHWKRHLRKVHKLEDEKKFNITKVTLDEPEIQIDNSANISTNLNDYSSHWPDYQEDDEELQTGATAPQIENVAATNPFSSGEESVEHQDFSNMNDDDVKQFVATFAHPEISIKVENTDYTEIQASEKTAMLNVDTNLQETKLKVCDFKQEGLGGLQKTELEQEAERQNFVTDNDEDDMDHFHDTSYHDEQSTADEDDNDDDDSDYDGDYKTNKKQQKEEHDDTKPPHILREKKLKKKIKTEMPEGSSTSTKVKVPRRRHGASKTEDNRCKVCDRSFTRYNHLLRHLLTHSDEKPHVCKFCSKGFTRSDHLQKHVQSIHCEKNFKCEQCDNAYGRKDHLLRHIETRHNKNPSAPKPQFECDMCEKKFTTKTYLIRHKLLHTDRLYACKHCPETFTEKEQMKEHQKKEHTQPRNFLCSICGDSFQRNEYLKIHMRRHTGEKPYKCRFCEKGFPRSTDLKMHERYHIGLKPNLCNLCGKGFHRPYNLTIHMRTHTGEKPYKCNQCPQAFAQSNDLKAHIRRHTGERFRCDLCSAAFLQRYGLNAHLRTVHGIVVTSFTGRLRKTEQSADAADGALPHDTDSTEQQSILMSETVQAQHSLTPVQHVDNSTTPPLYLGQHILNPMLGHAVVSHGTLSIAQLTQPPPPTQL